MMDGYTLDKIMRQDKHVAPYFAGVFAADTLPIRLHQRPALLICNTDPVSKPGTHWVAFYIGKHGEGEFWDSYGMPPIVPLHRKFLDRMCKKWTHNPTSLQAIDSLVCGEYCALYLFHRAHGHTLDCFVKKYFDAKDPHKNDAVVEKLFVRLFGTTKTCALPHVHSQRSCVRKK